jgi:uncharacterized Zn finger protein
MTNARRPKKHLAPAAEPSRLAQVRLRSDEFATLQETMRVLNLGSTSDALREGLRLLTAEAAATAAARRMVGPAAAARGEV